MKKNFFVLLAIFMFIFAVSGISYAKAGIMLPTQKSLQTQVSDQQTGVTVKKAEVKIHSEKQIFKDMTQSHWAYKIISDLKKMGIVNGDQDGNFNPERQVTRAEFATMLVRSMHLAVSEQVYQDEQTFTDVQPDFWAYKDVEAAKTFLNGYQNSDGQLYYTGLQSALQY